MAPPDARLREVFIHNIRPFCMDMVWTNIEKKNDTPCILYGNPSSIMQKTSVLFSQLLDLVTQDISEDQETFMLKHRRSDGYQAVVLRVSEKKEQLVTCTYRGLFVSTLHKTYKFHLDEYNVVFQNVRTGEICQHKSEEIARQHTGQYTPKYSHILDILSSKCHTTVVGDTATLPQIDGQCQRAVQPLPPSPFAFISDEEEPVWIPPEKERDSPFLPAFSLKPSGKVVYKSADGGEASSDDRRAVKFYEQLTNLRTCKSAKIMIIALHKSEVDTVFKDALGAETEPKQQVIIITNNTTICKQFSYQNTHLIQHLYFDDTQSDTQSERCVWAIVPLLTNTTNTARSIDHRYGPRALFAELLIVCEGRQDHNILEALKAEMLNYLKGGKSHFVHRMEEIKKIRKYMTDEHRAALVHMLSGTNIFDIDGKGNLLTRAMQICKSSVPFCVVVDADALFQIDKKTSVSAQNIACIRKDLPLEGRWAFNLDKKFNLSPDQDVLITWRDSPVTQYMAQICNKTINTRPIRHFEKLYEALDKKIPWLLGLKEGKENDALLKASNMFSSSQKFGRIFAWKRGDGTISGVTSIPKNRVLQSNQEELLKMMKNTTDKNTEALAEIQRFIEFILSYVFLYYKGFHRKRVDRRTRDYDKIETTAIARSQSFNVATSVSSKEGVLLAQGDIKIVTEGNQGIADRLEESRFKKKQEWDNTHSDKNVRPSHQEERPTRTKRCKQTPTALPKEDIQGTGTDEEVCHLDGLQEICRSSESAIEQTGDLQVSSSANETPGADRSISSNEESPIAISKRDYPECQSDPSTLSPSGQSNESSPNLDMHTSSYTTEGDFHVHSEYIQNTDVCCETPGDVSARDPPSTAFSEATEDATVDSN